MFSSVPGIRLLDASSTHPQLRTIAQGELIYFYGFKNHQQAPDSAVYIFSSDLLLSTLPLRLGVQVTLSLCVSCPKPAPPVVLPISANGNPLSSCSDETALPHTPPSNLQEVLLVLLSKYIQSPVPFLHFDFSFPGPWLWVWLKSLQQPPTGLFASTLTLLQGSHPPPCPTPTLA